MGPAFEAEAIQAAIAEMRGPIRSLWPVHCKPLADELLSSWIVRLAHGNGLRVQTFCNLFCGTDYQVWVRDIDRLPPTWLLDVISTRTNTSIEITRATTLRSYEGLLFDRVRTSGHLRWILTLQKFHRTQSGHAVQFCPLCLAEDVTPYIRKHWRVAFYTQCLKHKILLRDRCGTCDASVALHRIDMQIQDANRIPTASLATCHACGSDLRRNACMPPDPYDGQAIALLRHACISLHRAGKKTDCWDIGRYAVFHQLCRLLTTDDPHTQLREHTERQLGLRPMTLDKGRMPIEALPFDQRHHVIQLAAWLMVKLDSRLADAWRAEAVRYNMLLKDFDDPPQWYGQIVEKLAHWRDRLL